MQANRPEKGDCVARLWDLAICSSKKLPLIQAKMANFVSLKLSSQAWSFYALGHFGKLETWSSTFMLTILAKSIGKLVKIGKVVEMKNWPKLVEIFSKC